MVTSVPITILVAAVCGIFSALGLGGGSLLLLWMTAVVHLEPEMARSINLLFFIPAATVTFLTYFKKDRKRLAPLLPVMAGACLAAAAAALASRFVEPTLLQKGFAVYLLICGIQQLRYRPRNAR